MERAMVGAGQHESTSCPQPPCLGVIANLAPMLACSVPRRYDSRVRVIAARDREPESRGGGDIRSAFDDGGGAFDRYSRPCGVSLLPLARGRLLFEMESIALALLQNLAAQSGEPGENTHDALHDEAQGMESLSPQREDM